MIAKSKSAKDVFLAAAAMPAAERPAYLTDECGSNAALRAAVERLLAAHDAPESLLDPRPGLPTEGFGRPYTAQVGEIVAGRYKLVESIGEGGMGEVWVAQQTEPVRRVVAIKLIKPGMDSKAVLARFEAERQALALMDHPNIARVLDAGTTDVGRPYFVMELVKGVPITKFCDERKLTPRERLKLFVPVCQAVQHAHQKGIIHRYLKPSNVLVALYDDHPVPKVIDFGVAKAAGQPLTDRTLLTGFGTVVGTPEYMSPEQATFNALDVDTRTDIFSLGVLLYELLTGATPLDRKNLQTVGLLEVLRLVREQEPPRPSTRLSTAVTMPAIAAARNTEPHKLARLVRGELDWIVMRALDKDRTRRYETANGLAADVERYLAGDPVRAVPPSASYRARKFVRRNRGFVLAAAWVFAALVVGIIGSTIGLFRAESLRSKAVAAEQQVAIELENTKRERDRAQVERNAAWAVSEFLQYDIIGQASFKQQASWRETVSADLTVREALERAALKIEGKKTWNGRTEAMVRWAIGDAFVGIGQPEKAVMHLERAWKLMCDDQEYGPKHPDTVFGMSKLAAAYRHSGRADRALPLSQRTLEYALARFEVEPDDRQGPLLAMGDVALAYQEAGRLDESIRQWETANQWALEKFGVGNDHSEVAKLQLAETCRLAGQFPRAIELLNDLMTRVEQHGDDMFEADVRGVLGQALLQSGKASAAEPVLRSALATRRRRMPTAWATALTAAHLGEALTAQKKFEEAEPLLLDGYQRLKAREQTLPAHLKPRLTEAIDRLVTLYAAWGKADEATKYRTIRSSIVKP